jgi:hypothetical protein
MSRYGRAAPAIGFAAGFLCLAQADPPAGTGRVSQSLVHSTSSDVLTELGKLVKSDVASLEQSTTKNSAQDPGLPLAGAPVVMSPYIVRDIEDFEPIVFSPETPIVRILKKGILFDPAGNAHAPLVRMRFYTAVPGGVLTKGPNNGVELSASWSW